MNHWSSGIRVARGGLDPTGLIRNTKNINFKKVTEEGCQINPLGKINIMQELWYRKNIPVLRKPVFHDHKIS